VTTEGFYDLGRREGAPVGVDSAGVLAGRYEEEVGIERLDCGFDHSVERLGVARVAGARGQGDVRGVALARARPAFGQRILLGVIRASDAVVAV
jgi:hypothetical protein